MNTILITGANKGIGFEVARLLARNGYFVFLGSRDSARGEQAATKLRNEGLSQVESVAIDVTRQDSIASAFDRIRQRTKSLDALINNAGILGTIPQHASTFDVAEMQKIFDTNFFGAVRVTQQFLPLLQQSEAPRIVNVTSDLASLTHHMNPQWEFYPYRPAGYAPSKSALNAYTVMLAKELINTHLKVNAVNPGHTATEFNQYRGTKRPEDAAIVIAKYAMLDANGPTGKFFSDDGETPW
jgi:NAD(P)-dependent dehydrogenase (short-subunit alcohol dehydrogenase family)